MDKLLTPIEFEKLIHSQIPITESMGIKVIEFSPSYTKIGAELSKNINHKSTAFGGSINTLLTVCGWAITFANIKPFDKDAHIVIQKSNVEYLNPIHEDFTAECYIEETITQDKFLAMYKSKGKSRLNVEVICKDEKTIFAKFKAQYVVFK